MTAKTLSEDCILGTVTVGERGQIVIPSEMRKKLNIVTGDKLLAMSHPTGDGLVLFKVDAVRDFLSHLAAGLSIAELSEPETPTNSNQNYADRGTLEDEE